MVVPLLFGTAQHAVARGIVDIPFLVVTPGIPFDQLVEVVVVEGAGGATERAAGDVAPGGCKHIIQVRLEILKFLLLCLEFFFNPMLYFSGG
jgi:hypothetical protein